MNNATEKQFAFIRRMIAEARTTDAKIAWAMNGLDDHIDNREVGLYLQPFVMGVATEAANAHLAIYNGALDRLEWQIQAAEEGDILLTSEVAYQIADALKNPTLAAISGISYEYAKGPLGGKAAQRMYCRKITAAEKAEANATAIRVHLPAEIASQLVEVYDDVNTEFIEAEVGT